MKVNIIGGIHGSSGYSNHTKGLANALDKLIDVKLTVSLQEGWERMTNDRELEMIRKPDTFDRANIIIDLPFNWKQHCTKKVNIGFLVWEGDKIPLSFMEAIHAVTQVWVPSHHTYNAIKNTASNWESIKSKIFIVPHGVDLAVFKPVDQSRPESTFTFLVNKGFRHEYDRGGVQHALRAFVEEFTKGEARLVLKINPSYAMHPQQLYNYIHHTIAQTRRSPETIPEIAFNYDFMDQKQLNDLYNNCDVLLNPTEAEAFSLPCIEAMACGKPVITTNFGGQTDFVTPNNGWLVEGELHEIKHDIMYEGIKWCTPSIAGLRAAMRQSYSNKDDYNLKASRLINTTTDFTWENSAKKAVEALTALHNK